MVFAFPLPTININWNRPPKLPDKKEELTGSGDAPLSTSYPVDPVMLLLATAIVLLAAAMLVRATRA
jgi:hypothetical protein